jgi:hypothetical protein
VPLARRMIANSDPNRERVEVEDPKWERVEVDPKRMEADLGLNRIVKVGLVNDCKQTIKIHRKNKYLSFT